jgi:hypothetical protein
MTHIRIRVGFVSSFGSLHLLLQFQNSVVDLIIHSKHVRRRENNWKGTQLNHFVDWPMPWEVATKQRQTQKKKKKFKSIKTTTQPNQLHTGRVRIRGLHIRPASCPSGPPWSTAHSCHTARQGHEYAQTTQSDRCKAKKKREWKRISKTKKKTNH